MKITIKAYCTIWENMSGPFSKHCRSKSDHIFQRLFLTIPGDGRMQVFQWNKNPWVLWVRRLYWDDDKPIEPCGFMRGGVALRHTTSSTDVVVLCRPEEAPLVLNVDYWLGSAGEVHVDIYRLSGSNVLHREFPQAVTWWTLSNIPYSEQDLCHVQFVLRDQMVYKPHYNQYVVDELQDIDENILLPPPRPAAQRSRGQDTAMEPFKTRSEGESQEGLQ